MTFTLVSMGGGLLGLGRFLLAFDLLFEELTRRESSVGANPSVLSCASLYAGFWPPRIFRDKAHPPV